MINQLMKNSSFLILIGGLIAAFGGLLVAWGTYAAGKESEKQQQELQSKTDKNIELGNKNVVLGSNIEKLSKQIKSLQAINNEIAANTQNLGEKNFALNNQTQSLTKDIDQLTIRVNDLLGRVHKEITGGKSVPIVKADVGLTRPWSPDSYRNPVPLEYDGKWKISFKIQTYGEYPVSNVRLFVKASKYKQQTEEIEVENIGTVTREAKPVNIVEIGWLPDGFGPLVYNIRVSWKLQYVYRLEVYENRTFIQDENREKIVYAKSEHYLYKDVDYQNIDEFVKVIQKDLNN
jgi:gas vesicle protein